MSTEHLSFDELAELAEGLLARRRAAAVQAHLAECEECAERAAMLERSTETLRGLGPITMPEDVAARLTAMMRSAFWSRRFLSPVCLSHTSMPWAMSQIFRLGLRSFRRSAAVAKLMWARSRMSSFMGRVSWRSMYCHLLSTGS